MRKRRVSALLRDSDRRCCIEHAPVGRVQPHEVMLGQPGVGRRTGGLDASCRSDWFLNGAKKKMKFFELFVCSAMSGLLGVAGSVAFRQDQGAADGVIRGRAIELSDDDGRVFARLGWDGASHALQFLGGQPSPEGGGKQRVIAHFGTSPFGTGMPYWMLGDPKASRGGAKVFCEVSGEPASPDINLIDSDGVYRVSLRGVPNATSTIVVKDVDGKTVLSE